MVEDSRANNSTTSADSGNTVSLAVLSGKGGSGKTLICVSFLRALKASGPTLLVDADPGTGGLSYFLSLNYIKGQGPGLLGLLLPSTEAEGGEIDSVSETYSTAPPAGSRYDTARNLNDVRTTPDLTASIVVRELTGHEGGFVLPIGDIRRFIRTPLSAYQDRLGPVIDSVLGLKYGVTIFDCRGGIDAFTLQICRRVDTILVVTETDVASVQSTKNLLDVLKERGLDDKVGGFCINRLFDDASQYNRFMSGLFEVSFLGGVPFDIESMRRFLIGRMPRPSSAFVANSAAVAEALFANRRDIYVDVVGPVYKGADFARLSLRDPREVGGQALGASLITAFSFFFVL